VLKKEKKRDWSQIEAENRVWYQSETMLGKAFFRADRLNGSFIEGLGTNGGNCGGNNRGCEIAAVSRTRGALANR
jgi:hypothetical protein